MRIPVTQEMLDDAEPYRSAISSLFVRAEEEMVERLKDLTDGPRYGPWKRRVWVVDVPAVEEEGHYEERYS